MGIFLLKSNNENMSHVIGKNPASGMSTKSIRKGKSFGWFSDDDTYLVYFKDNLNSVSFGKNKEDGFEYNDLTRYNSPVLVLNILTEYFSSSYKKVHEKDTDGFNNSIELVLEIQRLNLIKNMFYRVEDVEVVYNDIGGNNYKVLFKTTKNINHLLNFIGVYCLFVSIIDGYYMNINDEMIKKYVNSLNKLGATYYMKYLFMLKVIPNKRLFNLVKDVLEKDDNHKLELMFGSTADWRRDFVFDKLSWDNDVIDLGCGDGFYTLPMAKKIPDKSIFAIDIDEECIERVSGISESRGYDNVTTYDSLSSYKKLNGEDGKVDIIMVEVIEHMEKDEARYLLKEVMKLNFNSIFITSPVQEFNVHYDLENSTDDRVKNGFRHEDHKWEGTVSEFTGLILDCMRVLQDKDFNHSYKHYMIGDKVDGYAPTQGIIITKC